MKKDRKLIGAGLITAIASSLCCIAPILALISGTSGIASTFHWLEPYRPYLIGFTILILGFAWYNKLKPQKEIDCECNQKSSFIQSKLLLGIVTIFAIAMTLFPYYSFKFYTKKERGVIVADKLNIQTINSGIKGMTCRSCEKQVNNSVNQLSGILKIKSSYKNENAEIEFNNSKTTIEEIKKSINSTGYLVIKTKEN